jgi:hypothetical protein
MVWDHGVDVAAPRCERFEQRTTPVRLGFGAERDGVLSFIYKAAAESGAGRQHPCPA